jgi:hypothetical protein
MRVVDDGQAGTVESELRRFKAKQGENARARV